MKTVAIIQARMGSSRLPGKMMFPLDCDPVVNQVIRRVSKASELDMEMLATTNCERDDILVDQGQHNGVDVYRGSESDVLKRMYSAAKSTNADVIVRVCADNPLIAPACIDTLVSQLKKEGVDYASCEQSLPIGLGAEAFTMNSFSIVDKEAAEPHEREHVTVYYRDNPDQFSLTSIGIKDIFDKTRLIKNTDIRLTLDTAADYKLLRQVYQNVSPDYREIVDVNDSIRYIKKNNLTELNAHITQKDPKENE